MGEVIRIKCNDCNTSYDLQTGQGMRDNDPSNFINLFPVNLQSQINSIISSNTAWDFSHMPALCRTCKAFTTVPVFMTIGNETAHIRGICGCGDDGNNAVIINTEENVKTKCPLCGGNVVVEQIGMWD